MKTPRVGIPVRFSFVLALLLTVVAGGCASSRRMARLSSGIMEDYHVPHAHDRRSEHFRQKSRVLPSDGKTSLSSFQDELINLWPLFYHSGDYTSFVWPMMDFDSYGMAIRPVYNHEGDEYSFLFPLCAWNAHEKDGWCLPAWWDFHADNSKFNLLPIGGYNRTRSTSQYWFTPFLIHDEMLAPELSLGMKSSYVSFNEVLGFYDHHSIYKDTSSCPWVHGSADSPALQRELTYRFVGTGRTFPPPGRAFHDFQKREFDALPVLHRYKWGYFPLFHFEESPTLTKRSFLLDTFSGEWNGNGTSFEILWKVLANYNRRKGRTIHGDVSLYETRKFYLPLLLSRFHRWTHYDFGDVKAVETFNKLWRHFGGMEPGEFTKRKSEIQTLLTQLDASFKLPDTVTDGRTLELYVQDNWGKLDFPTYRTYEGGSWPFLSYRVGRTAKRWGSVALLTEYEKSAEDVFRFRSLPLLTYIDQSPNEDFATVAGPLLWYSKRLRGTRGDKKVFGQREQRGHESAMIEFEDDYGFMGLYYHGRDHFQVARPGVDAGKVEAVRSKLLAVYRRRAEVRRWKERLDQEEKSIAARETKRKIDLYRKLVAQEELLERRGEWQKQKDKYDKEWAELRALGEGIGFPLGEELPEGQDAVCALRERLVVEYSELRCIEDYGNGILHRREKLSNGDYNWHVLRGLASGKKEGDSEEMKILYLLYRSHVKGERVEKTIFPFIAIQRDGENKRYSFFWRLFNYERKAGKTRLNLFFIPFTL